MSCMTLSCSLLTIITLKSSHPGGGKYDFAPKRLMCTLYYTVDVASSAGSPQVASWTFKGI